MPYRQSQVRADITVGSNHLGVADAWNGGAGGADTGTYRRASGDVALGGAKTREDGTAKYLCDEAFWALWPTLDRARGNARATVVITPVADDGTPFASGAITLTGTLITVPVPQGDFSSNEGNAIELGFQLDAERA